MNNTTYTPSTACTDCGDTDDTTEYQWTGEYVCDECGYERYSAEGFLSTLDDLRDWGK